MRRACALIVVCAIAGITTSTHLGAKRLERRWSSGRAVLVASANIQPGDPLDAEVTESRPMPEALIPPGAVESVAGESVARSYIAEGEVVVGLRVASPDTLRAPPHMSSILVEPVVPPPTVEPGDEVDVLAWNTSSEVADTYSRPEDADPRTGPEAASVVATSAVVLVPPSDDEPALTLAVSNRDVPLTAAAALGTGVVVVLRGG